MRITIQTIPHSNQRYETVGDWFYNGDDLIIAVSDLGNLKHELLVAIHELAEAVLCKDRGVQEEQVSKFDMDFESTRPEGDTSEPGDHPLAPYRREHFMATTIERLLASELGVDWMEYENAINEL